MFWNIVILRKNMLPMSNGLCNGCLMRHCLWWQTSANALRRQWDISGWLYQQPGILWIRIRLKECGMAVGKRRLRTEDWIAFFKYSSSTDCELLLTVYTSVLWECVAFNQIYQEGRTISSAIWTTSGFRDYDHQVHNCCGITSLQSSERSDYWNWCFRLCI